MKRFIAILIVLLLSVSLVACGSGSGAPAATTTPAPAAPAPAPAPAPKPATPAPTPSTPAPAPAPTGYNGPVMQVDIVTMCPMSGSSARTGILEEASISAAEQHMAEDNFLNPAYKLNFVRPFVDDESSTDKAPFAANLAISLEPHGIIGHHLTTMILISMPFAEEARIPMIGIVSGPASVRQGWEFFHIGTVTDTDAAVTLAEYLVKERGFKNFLVMARNDEGGMAGAEAVIATIKTYGVSFDDTRQYMLFASDDTDFTPHAMRAKDIGADCVITYGLGGQNALTCYDQIEQLYARIPEDVFYCGSTSFAQPSIAEMFPPDKLQGLVFPTGYIQDPNDPFKERFKHQFKANDPQGFWPGDNNARVYDACWTFAGAINDMVEAEGYLDPADKPFFRERLNYYISQHKRVGVQGNIDYSAFTDGRMLASGNIGEWQSDGQAIKVYPK